jgi:ribosome biogenesis protein Tsr3
MCMQPLSVDSHSVVHIPMPHIFVSCQQQKVDLPGRRWNEVVTGSAAVSAKSGGVLDWMVPAGNPADYGVVARFTAISALTGVLVVLGASVSGERRI